jgi:chorismate mutase
VTPGRQGRPVAVLLLVGSLLVLPGCTSDPSAPISIPARSAHQETAVDPLLQLMARRLALMRDVARWKWNAGKPIADPEREMALLDTVARRACHHRLDPALVRAFFTAQMEAGKQVQQADFERWRTAGQPPFDDVRALADIRRELDELSEALLVTLADAQPHLETPAGRRLLEKRAQVVLTGAGLDKPVRDAMVRPLLTR